MRLLSILLLSSFFGHPASAQSTEPLSKPSENSGSARETAVDNLLSERGSAKALDAVITEARKAGVTEQAVLEARFLYHVDRQEDDAIAAMLPEFLKQQEHFDIKESEIFSVKEDWLAVIEYVQAIASMQKGDKAAFKTHITEAFWLSPRQASAFAPHIERMRLDEAMRSVKIDFETRLTPLAGGDTVALGKLLEGNKAMLLHFWSSASRESEDSLPDFVATAAALMPKGIAIVSILPQDSPKEVTDSRKMIQSLGAKPAGAWLIDSKETSLMRELRVQSLPLFVLVSKTGAILFNGEPTDDAFWDALTKVDPQITRPSLAAPAE